MTWSERSQAEAHWQFMSDQGLHSFFGVGMVRSLDLGGLCVVSQLVEIGHLLF